MPDKFPSTSATAAPDARFTTTRWTRVLLAAGNGSADGDAALAEICARYWQPIYAFLRRSGYPHVDAEDLTQEFFSRLLAKKWLTVADPTRGRFRSFLLSALKHFIANDWRRGHTLQRGGHLQFLSFDEIRADFERPEQGETLPPDALYERRWAINMLTHALANLRDEYENAGKTNRFRVLEQTLSGERTEEGYVTMANQLGLTVNGVKAAVRRLRRRCGELLRAEVADTVSDRAEIESELRYLQTVLSKTH